MPPHEPTVIPDLTTEADIPEDGTLSRVLFSDDLLRLVLFAFDEGQELTEHTASVPAVVQVVSGRFRLTLGDEVVEAEPGAWMHMPADLPHAVEALQPGHLLLTMLRND
jgi:quercetin dioxygenase-like cupin family protein